MKYNIGVHVPEMRSEYFPGAAVMHFCSRVANKDDQRVKACACQDLMQGSFTSLTVKNKN